MATVRDQMNMDVAFITRITGDDYTIRNAAGSGSTVDVGVGMTVPLSATHCSLVVAADAPILLNDTATDPRSRDMGATTIMGIGAYLGVPVRMSDGSLYGTLCCTSAAPAGQLSDRDVSFLAVLADVVAGEIEIHERQAVDERERRRGVETLLGGAGLNIVYQPIVDLATRTPRGYEALSRVSLEPRRTPDLWFGDAASVGLGAELECHAIRLALDGFDFSEGAYVSLNASPETVTSGAFADAIAGRPADRIVVEVTEHAPVFSYPDLLDALDKLRADGVRLAIDDAGAGYAGLSHILMLRPEIIKLDIALTRDVDSDPIRRALAQALVAFASELKASIVAEGIETAQEYETLAELGVDLGQGYHIAKPAPWSELPH